MRGVGVERPNRQGSDAQLAGDRQKRRRRGFVNAAGAEREKE